MKQNTYLITAATGATGREAIPSLLGHGQQNVRAFVHREDERHAEDRFDPYRVGLDHIALGVPCERILPSSRQWMI